MNERQFWLNLYARFWPLKIETVEHLTRAALRYAFIFNWTASGTGVSYRCIVKKGDWYPLELVRSITPLSLLDDRITCVTYEIEMRAAKNGKWSIPNHDAASRTYNLGRSNAVAAFHSARYAQRFFSTTFEGGYVTAFGDEIFFHNSVLLRPLVSLFGKRIVHPAGTRIDLITIKKSKWLDTCHINHKGQKNVLQIGSEIVLKGLKK